MDWNLTLEQGEWRQEVRAFLRENLDSDTLAEGRAEHFSTGPKVKDLLRKLGATGWHSLTWPSEYGGSEQGAVMRMIMLDEWQYARAPRITYVEITTGSLAPVIIKYGTEANKDDWLEGIRKGDVVFALGYSEPDAGTDLASLSTRAVQDGDEWVINGQKIWNSAAHVTTHEWLAVRTGSAEDKHRGISIVVVPIDAPGVEVNAIETWPGHRTNQTFFTDVRVPLRNLIGQVNQGWNYLAYALDFERIALGGQLGGARRLLDDLTHYVQATTLDGAVLSSRPAVRDRIAALEARLEAAQLMSMDVALKVEKGETPTVEGTALKIFTAELRGDIADLGMEMIGLAGQLDREDGQAPLLGSLDVEYRENPILVFGGGTNDVMRDIIAQRGLHLPRTPRQLAKASERKASGK